MRDLLLGGRYGRRMTCRKLRWGIWLLVLAAWPVQTPAPFIYRPGEGIFYEPVGAANWMRNPARAQMEVAETSFTQGDFATAIKSARRTISVWPESDYVSRAKYLLGRAFEALGEDEKAFDEYQKLFGQTPGIENYEEVLERQYNIAIRFLSGQWSKALGVIPVPFSADKAAAMLTNVVKNGPYSAVAPRAQIAMGEAQEKQGNFPEAVKAYELAADRYHQQKEIAAEARFRAGMVYQKQARKGEYDQSTAGRAIATLTDFITLYPSDPRVAEAEAVIKSLRTEQARGNFERARFYESRKSVSGALVYYNEVITSDADSPYAAEARKRIEELGRIAKPASAPR